MAIRDGQEDLIQVLWTQVKRFVAKLANDRCHAVRNSVADFEDYMQAGFIAVTEAVKTYTDANGVQFASWLAFYVRREFNKAAGIYTPRLRLDPVNNALSLDAPISADDPEGSTLADVIPDRTDPFAGVDAVIWHEQLAAEMAAALADLPDDQRRALQRRYYEALTISAAAEAEGVTTGEIRVRENRGLSAIRRSPHRARLEAFRATMHEIDRRTPWYRGLGLTKFQETGERGVERLVIQRDQMYSKMSRNDPPVNV